ncbi:MAG: hypothetical protein J6V44_16490 [Methanobrevibacter sp.]|nr:hypothetical protein [Methanobrevibacter sp.]MBO7692000.1 hypothetical protein [Methanobrevibacter sp.]
MPNWCYTNIEVRGKTDVVKKLVEMVKSEKDEEGKATDFDFNKIVPQPKTYEECPPEYRIDSEEDARKEHLSWDEEKERNWFNWYKWNCDNWGTKWGACDANTDLITLEKPIGKTAVINIYLSTAWSPALPVYRKLQEMYPELEIKVDFADEGGGFVGRLRPDGEEEEYGSSDPEFKEVCDSVGCEYLYEDMEEDEDEDSEGWEKDYEWEN